MKLKFLFISLSFFTFIFGIFLPKSVSADAFTLSGNVSSSTGANMDGATIDVIDPSSNIIIVSATTNLDGNYNMIVNGGRYNVQVAPTAGSGFTPAIALDQNIFSGKTLNFVLVPAGSLLLSGHVYDALGNAAQGIEIRIYSVTSSGQTLITTQTTNESGSYSALLSPGTYMIQYTKYAGTNLANFPTYALVRVPNYVLNQSTELNITLPLKKVTVHVQDVSGNPVGNVGFNTTSPNLEGLNLGSGVTNGAGTDYYQGGSVVTDTSGNAVLWLLPGVYNITAVPPGGSGFTSTSLNVNVAGDMNLPITLPQSLNFSGHVYDALGNESSGVVIRIYSITSSGQTFITSKTTDSSGSYSAALSPGKYLFEYYKLVGNNLANFPTYVLVRVPNYVLNQDTVMDITFPLKKVQIVVKDESGNPISNVQFSTTSPNVGGLTLGEGITNGTGTNYYLPGHPVTDASGNAVLWLLPGAYNITAVPPGGSGFSANTVNVNVSSNTNLTMTLEQPLELSGHVYDVLGNAVQSIEVRIFSITSSGQTFITSKTTDSSGRYSAILTSGTYLIQFTKYEAINLVNFPTYVLVRVPNYVLNQSTVLDITIPFKKVTVHVQDTSGNPVGNVGFNTTSPNLEGLNLGSGVANGTGTNYYQGSSVTDTLGNVDLWLLPGTYGITATPLSGSPYAQFTLNNIMVTSDMTEIISLQYNHEAPTTSIDLQTQHTDGAYSDPTTIMITATAAAGFSVANTYYKVDGGSQHAYSTPFDVSGVGNHTVEFWSVDNSGVQEIHKTKNFTIAESYQLSGIVYIDINQNGVQDENEVGYEGAEISLNTGQTTTSESNGSYSISNIQQGSYTETLSIPTGYTVTTTNPAEIALSSDTTQNFGIAPVPTNTPTPTYTPTPTETPTPTPTATPTPTDTPTPTPTDTPTPTPIPTYSITGVVYIDTNTNGVQDTEELGYDEAEINLNTGQTATTGNNGNYSLTNLQAGTYTETLTVPAGYTATTSNPVEIALSANTTQNFGIAPVPTNTLTPTDIPTPTPVTQITVTFDDIPTAIPFTSTTYGGIDWSVGIWELDPAIPTDSTQNISFDSPSITSTTFEFNSPQVLISMGLYSNQNQTALITLSCSGNSIVSKTVEPGTSTTLTTGWTVPCTTVTVTSSNSWNTSFDNIVYASSSDGGGITPTPTPGGNNLGNVLIGSHIDTSDTGYINGSKFTTGGAGGTVTSMSVFVGAVDNATHRQFQMAIYSDLDGKPRTKIASTATGNLTPFSWNTLPITATLAPNTTYWLMYNTNSRVAQNLNNMYYIPGEQGIAAWKAQSFGNWPATINPTSLTMDDTLFSIYASY